MLSVELKVVHMLFRYVIINFSVSADLCICSHLSHDKVDVTWVVWDLDRPLIGIHNMAKNC